MKKFLSPERISRLSFVISLIAFIAFSVFIFTRPLLWLLGFAADDAFYYLNIAQNIAAGHGSTFDGINPTNGYHPVWMIILAVLTKFVSDKELLVRLTLTLSFLFHLGTALTIVQITKHFISRNAALIAGAVWLNNPLPLLLSMHAVESQVYLFFLAITIAFAVKKLIPLFVSSEIVVPSYKTCLPFGALMGITFLARTEAIFFAALTFLFLIIFFIQWKYRFKEMLRIMGFIIAAFAAVVLPWFIYSYSITGSIAQDSGAMKVLWGMNNYHGLDFFGGVYKVIYYFYHNWLSRTVLMLTGITQNTKSVFAAVLVLITAVITFRLFTLNSIPKLKFFAVWLITSTVLTGIIYGLFISGPQYWYISQPGLLLYLLIVIWTVFAFNKSGLFKSHKSKTFFGVLAICISLALFVKLWIGLNALYPWQRDVFISQHQFEERIPPGSRIGSFNAGIPGYFSRHTTINLDGLVNTNVQRYWKGNVFNKYLADVKISYVIDERDALAQAQQFSSEPLRLTAIDSVRLTGWSSEWRVLWEVDIKK